MPRKETIAIIDDPVGSSLKVSSQRFDDRTEIWIETRNFDKNRWTGSAMKLDSRHAVEAVVYTFIDASERIFQTVEDLKRDRGRSQDYRNHAMFERSRPGDRYPNLTAMFFSDNSFGRGDPEWVVTFNGCRFTEPEVFSRLAEVLVESRSIFVE